MSKYRRVILNDSSDISTISNSNDDQVGTHSEITVNGLCDLSNNRSDVDKSIISMESVKNQFECEEREDDDSSTSTYEEDSFLVKDSSADLDAWKSFKEEQRSFISKCTSQNLHNHSRKALKLSGEVSIQSASTEEDLLLELYPELRSGKGTEKKRNDESDDSEDDGTSNSLSDSSDNLDEYLNELKAGESQILISNSDSKEFDSFQFIVDDSYLSFISESNESLSENDDSTKDTSTTKDLINNESNVSSKSDKENDINGLSKGYEKMERKSTLKPLTATDKKESFEKVKLKEKQNFLLALSDNNHHHPEAARFTKKKFNSIRMELAENLLQLYDETCFDNKLTAATTLDWNVRMTKTAGRCVILPRQFVRIVLSVKVCNTPDRLRDTLLHELCHAAVWIINGVLNEGHGSIWKSWVRTCGKVFPLLPKISRCHNYTIAAKYAYVCECCGQKITRHSKSLNIDLKVCGICGGKFALLKNDGSNQTVRSANRFAEFVKTNYAKERKTGRKHGDVMKLLSQQFKEMQIRKEDEIS